MMSRTRARKAWIAGLATLLVAGGASAAEVTKVRVGNHPTFTRVVFELDASAGYRIEKGRADDGGSEIRVTLEAGARQVTVDRKTVMVERVALEQGAAQSVAHIRLRKDPSRVKEMILANPPRIVFDLVFPESQLAAIRRAKQEKAAARAAAEAARKAKPVTTAGAEAAQQAKPVTTAGAEAAQQAKPVTTAGARPEPEAKPAPARKPEPESKPAPPRRSAPSPLPVAQKPEPKPVAPKPEPVVKVEKPAPKPEPFAKVEKPAPEPAVAPAAKPTPLAKLEPEASKQLAARSEPAAPKPAKPATRPEKVAKVARPAAKPAPAPSGGIDWVLWGSVAAGGLLLTMVVVLMLRRRSLPNDMDVTAVAEEQVAEGALPDGGFLMDAPQDAPTVAESSSAVASAPDVESRPAEVDIAAGPGLFDDEDPEKESESMDLENSGMEQSASEVPTQLGGGAAGAGAADIARLARDLERRMAQMEARLDEANEARERLERQVAAQAEELRVQRAAIARTQRALRSLNRPSEEQATEPALREPSS